MDRIDIFLSLFRILKGVVFNQLGIRLNSLLDLFRTFDLLAIQQFALNDLDRVHVVQNLLDICLLPSEVQFGLGEDGHDL